MKQIPLEPAHYIITTLGGAAAVAEVVGIDRTQVWRWTQPKSKKGTGGLIPSEHQETLLTWAHRIGKPITAESFFRSRKVPRAVSRPQRIVA